MALASTRPPPTVPMSSPAAVTSILLPASCGVLPTVVDERDADERRAAGGELGEAFDVSVGSGHGKDARGRETGDGTPGGF